MLILAQLEWNFNINASLVFIAFGIILLLLLIFVPLKFIPKGWTVRQQGQPSDNDPLFQALSNEQVRCRIERVGAGQARWQECDIQIFTTYAAIRPQTRFGSESFTFNKSNIRWLGELKQDELWLDIDIDGQWSVVQLSMPKSLLRRCTDLLEQMTPDDLLLERNRQRPNLRRGPTEAHPAEQELQGAWLLEDPIYLYLTPLYLLVMKGEIVRYRIPLNTIEQPEALPRVDAPDQPGLMRFEVNGETLAFALDDYVGFAQAIADATNDPLEKHDARKSVEDDVTGYDDGTSSERSSSKKQI